MTTWKTELTGSLLSAATLLPVAYATAGVEPLAGAVLLGSAELVGRTLYLALRCFNQTAAHVAYYLGYFAGGLGIMHSVAPLIGYTAIAHPIAIRMLAAAAVVMKFVRDKLVPMEQINLAKEVTEELILRPLNGAFWASVVAHVFTSVPFMAAGLTTYIVFLAARVSVFVAKKFPNTKGNEILFMVSGAIGGLLLSTVVIPYLGWTPIAWKHLFLGGIGTMIPAVTCWEGIKKVSEFIFTHWGWKKPPVDKTPHKPMYSRQDIFCAAASAIVCSAAHYLITGAHPLGAMVVMTGMVVGKEWIPSVLESLGLVASVSPWVNAGSACAGGLLASHVIRVLQLTNFPWLDTVLLVIGTLLINVPMRWMYDKATLHVSPLLPKHWELSEEYRRRIPGGSKDNSLLSS